MHHKERKQLAMLHSWEVPKAAFEADPLAAKSVLKELIWQEKLLS